VPVLARIGGGADEGLEVMACRRPVMSIQESCSRAFSFCGSAALCSSSSGQPRVARRPQKSVRPARDEGLGDSSRQSPSAIPIATSSPTRTVRLKAASTGSSSRYAFRRRRSAPGRSCSKSPRPFAASLKQAQANLLKDRGCSTAQGAGQTLQAAGRTHSTDAYEQVWTMPKPRRDRGADEAAIDKRAVARYCTIALP